MSQKSKRKNRNLKKWSLKNYSRMYGSCYMHRGNHRYCSNCIKESVSVSSNNEQKSLEKLTEETRKWASSEEGQEQIRKSREDTMKTIKELDESRKITWEQLHTPMTF